ncbi:hypothetical protein [Catellatospora vulcania]|uniref:hypothetical protein n=1 Tax=Catellatospora vulcania TaxID=1460450 RepID=UPI0012D46419|nr:hypothetical protein [Catellatospora vulcania]
MREPVYRVVRIKITEATTPNQALEIDTVDELKVALALQEILRRKPAVRAGREAVQVVQR